MTTHGPLFVILAAVVLVLLAVIGAAVYLGKRGYGLSLAAKLEPKAPPKAAPAAPTVTFNGAVTDEQARTVTQEVTR